MFTTFSDIFRSVIYKHVPFKTKIIRGNQASFMMKALSEAIITRSRLRSKYNKWPSRENFLAFRKAKHYCNNLNKMTKKAYFEQNIFKPFLTNEDFFTFETIPVENKGKLINDNLKLTGIFNTRYTSGVPPSTAENPNNS